MRSGKDGAKVDQRLAEPVARANAAECACGPFVNAQRILDVFLQPSAVLSRLNHDERHLFGANEEKKEAQIVENIIGGELQRRDAVDLPDRFRCRVQTIGMVVVAEILRGEAGGRRPCGVTKAQEVNVGKKPQGHAIDRRRLRPARARLVDRLQAVEKFDADFIPQPAPVAVVIHGRALEWRRRPSDPVIPCLIELSGIRSRRAP